MTTWLAIALVLVYHAATGMKRGAWEHTGQIIETVAIGMLLWLITNNIVATIGAMIAGNCFFQWRVNPSFGKPWYWLEEPWTFPMDFRGRHWEQPKWLWFPPSLAGRWRFLQLAIGAGLIAWGGYAL